MSSSSAKDRHILIQPLTIGAIGATMDLGFGLFCPAGAVFLAFPLALVVGTNLLLNKYFGS